MSAKDTVVSGEKNQGASENDANGKTNEFSDTDFFTGIEEKWQESDLETAPLLTDVVNEFRYNSHVNDLERRLNLSNLSTFPFHHLTPAEKLSSVLSHLSSSLIRPHAIGEAERRRQIFWESFAGQDVPANEATLFDDSVWCSFIDLIDKGFVKINWKEIRNLFLCFCCLFGFTITGFAQTAEWIYIARSTEGRYFVKRKIDRIDPGNRGMWMKIVSDDDSEQISYSEWDCQNRRFRLKQTSSFNADGTTVWQLKNLDWAYVSPETVSEDLFEEACGTPRQIKYAVIILKEVKLRDAPGPNGQVYRTVKRSERFPLTPFNPVGAWFQIYDPKTLAEYWVHGNAIKIVADGGKSPQTVKRSPGNSKGSKTKKQ
jgi:hypothetical protein